MSLSLWRFLIFVMILCAVSFLELHFAFHKRVLRRQHRWPSHVILIALSSLATFFLFRDLLPFMPDYGLATLRLPRGVQVFITVIALDFALYWQHVLTHKVDFLWRFHRVHHTDVDLDGTSALRFHPIEMIFSAGYKLLWCWALGLSWEGFFVFEVVLSSSAIFSHSNIALSQKWEKYVRYFVVTPQMHVVHHSWHRHESDKNFGFFLSIWDRLFATYLESVGSGSKIGQKAFRAQEDQAIISLLKQPLRGDGP